MSRFHKYTRSLVTGYLLLFVNTLYTLLSVPLGLYYLSIEEFGLWALMAQFAGYMALIDAGMTSSVARILVDYKDDTAGDKYGSVIKTSFLVATAQGGLILLFSPVMFWFAAVMPGVPAELGRQFGWLLAGQCGLLALSFFSRTFFNLLWAHQRTDASNYVHMVCFILNLATQWYCLSYGMGVYAILWAQGIATLAGLALTGWACWDLKLLPTSDRWGLASWHRFRELFSFGKDLFIATLGLQMVSASQVIIVTMCMGLEAAAVWSVCLRGYNLLSQVVWRIVDYSVNPLSEMLVRGEMEKFVLTFRRVTVLTTATAVAVAAIFASINQPFVHVWTQGKMGWAQENDLLLAVLLISIAVQRCHCGLLNVRKDLAVLKYVYCVEGTLFLAMGFSAGGWGGYTAIIASSILANAAISLRYGLHRTKRDFHLNWRELLAWWYPAFKIGLALLPITLLLLWMGKVLSPWTGLIVVGCGALAAGAWATARWGLDSETKLMVCGKLPRRLRPFLGQS